MEHPFLVATEAMRRYHDLIVATLTNPTPSCLDVVHHRRKRGEIERYVVAESAGGRWYYRVAIALADQIEISNFHIIGIQHFRFLAVEPMVQNPWDIVPMDDPEDERSVWRKILGHDDDSASHRSTVCKALGQATDVHRTEREHSQGLLANVHANVDYGKPEAHCWR